MRLVAAAVTAITVATLTVVAAPSVVAAEQVAAPLCFEVGVGSQSVRICIPLP